MVTQSITDNAKESLNANTYVKALELKELEKI